MYVSETWEVKHSTPSGRADLVLLLIEHFICCGSAFYFICLLLMNCLTVTYLSVRCHIAVDELSDGHLSLCEMSRELCNVREEMLISRHSHDNFVSFGELSLRELYSVSCHRPMKRLSLSDCDIKIFSSNH